MQGFRIWVHLKELVLYLTLPESSPQNAYELNSLGSFQFGKSMLGEKLNRLLKVPKFNS